LAAVRKAARLAVYEEIMMRVKNHHMPATIRVEIALGGTPKKTELEFVQNKVPRGG
jgi:hypothetical protein